MPRNMSFALTTKQIRERTKTVTRRTRWLDLKAGDVINAVVKSMGLKPGEKVEKLATIRVVSARREQLWDCSDAEAAKEGFPEMNRGEFISMFCEHMGGGPSQMVTRIEFEYVD